MATRDQLFGSEEYFDPEDLTKIGDLYEQDPSQFEEETASPFLNGLLPKVQARFNRWKNVPLQIAVTGNSGAGKSSFINAIRGIDDEEDKTFAKVGVTETTKDAMAYSDPNNPRLVFWDLPGIGTPSFTKDKYKQQIGLDRFDFYIILANKRFTENDLWLANLLRTEKKSAYLFARTHIGVDVYNDSESHKKTHNKTKLLKQIRDDLEKNLKESGIPDSSIFLIDNLRPYQYDFGKMQKSLSENVSEKKHEAMVLSATRLSSEMLDMKVETLKRRVPAIIDYCQNVTVIKIPFLTEYLRLKMLKTEGQLYRDQLGLTEDDLAKTAKELEMEPDEMIEKLEINLKNIRYSFFKSPKFDELIAEFIFDFLSFFVTRDKNAAASKANRYLEEFLDELKSNALKVISAAITEHASRK